MMLLVLIHLKESLQAVHCMMVHIKEVCTLVLKGKGDPRITSCCVPTLCDIHCIMGQQSGQWPFTGKLSYKRALKGLTIAGGLTMARSITIAKFII